MGIRSSKSPTNPPTKDCDKEEVKEVSAEQVESIGRSLMAALQRGNIDAVSNILQYEALDVLREAWKKSHIFHWTILSACTFTPKQMQNLSDLFMEHKDKLKDLMQAGVVQFREDKYLRMTVSSSLKLKQPFEVRFSTISFQPSPIEGDWAFTVTVPPSTFTLAVQATVPFKQYDKLHDHTTLLLTMLKSLQSSTNLSLDVKRDSLVSASINNPIASAPAAISQPPAYSIAANNNE